MYNDLTLYSDKMSVVDDAMEHLTGKNEICQEMIHQMIFKLDLNPIMQNQVFEQFPSLQVQLPLCPRG